MRERERDENRKGERDKMPPKYKFTKEQITAAALETAKEKGMSGVTAREVARRLDSSSKVIFGLFENMNELMQSVIAAAEKDYRRYIEEDMKSGIYPPYKASGMAYIRFAKEEPELFKLLFMRDRTEESDDAGFGNYDDIIEIIMFANGFSREKAELLHLEMWIFTHGIATMSATSYLTFDIEMISRMMTDAYMSIRERIRNADIADEAKTKSTENTESVRNE